MKMKMMMGVFSKADGSCHQNQQCLQQKNNDRRASQTSTETTAAMTTSSAATWTSFASPSPTPAENTSSAKKRPFSEKRKCKCESKKDNADDIIDNIPKEIFIVVNEDDVDVEDERNPFRFEAVSSDATVTRSATASYPDADVARSTTRRNSSPAAGSLPNRQRPLDSIPQMPLPLSLRQHQHRHQRQLHTVASDSAGATGASGPDSWMFQAAPLRRSSYYFGGRGSQHSLHLLQQTLMLPSMQISSSGEDTSNTKTMTTLEIVSKAIEIADSAVEEMEEHQQDQLCHHHDDYDDHDDDYYCYHCPETERGSGLQAAIGASSTSSSCSSSSSGAATDAAAVATARLDRFNVLDIPPKAPKRKESSEELMALRYPSDS
jgi:hypothetical protein